jgi:uncharacterized membrane protein
MKIRSYIIRGILFCTIVFAVQYLFIASIPNLVFFIAKHRSGKPLNTVIQAPKTDAKLRKVVLPNPDFVYNAVFYDVCKSDLIVSGEFPDSSQYCALAFYGDNAQPYRVINNLKTNSKSFKFHLSQKKSDSITVVSPTSQGALLMRILVTDNEQYKNAIQLQKLMKVLPSDK